MTTHLRTILLARADDLPRDLYVLVVCLRMFAGIAVVLSCGEVAVAAGGSGLLVAVSVGVAAGAVWAAAYATGWWPKP